MADDDDEQPPGQDIAPGPAPRGPRAPLDRWKGVGAGEVACGAFFNVVRRPDGSVCVFGATFVYAMHDEDVDEVGRIMEPVRVPGINNVRCVAAGQPDCGCNV
jgi:hypothetical protein